MNKPKNFKKFHKKILFIFFQIANQTVGFLTHLPKEKYFKK